MPKVEEIIMKNVQAIILGAGKGTRINAKNIPKVMYLLAGRPIISYILDTLKKIKIKPVIVVGFKCEVIKKQFPPYDFALQQKRLGTGHAVMCAKDKILPETATILVLNGDDSAFYKPETLVNLILAHQKDDADLSLLTLVRNNPAGLGRILRDKDGKILGIIEEKLATATQKKIKEVNCGCYCFKPSFLWPALKKVKKNSTGEYFLTDVVGLAVKEGKKIESFIMKEPNEWLGINTYEELEQAQKKMQQCLAA